ncbi:MAG: CUAEP/CCAEP-tail radical SAM protein [Planctomycetota bacterium]|nr:CUAEP/CCAEP-tail radical SAM protein [Planctomycetota bacterium]
MQVLLISTYELGRQPFGLASPAAWLKRTGASVTCIDLAVQSLSSEMIGSSDLVAFYLPMHTATRIAIPIVERVRRINPKAHLCFYGLYAPLNQSLLRKLGAQTILGGEFEEGLSSLVKSLSEGRRPPGAPQPEPVVSLSKLRFLVPDREGLPDLSQYAHLDTGSTGFRTVGYTEATRGCKHLCRHCPIVPVYGGQFRVVQRDVVLRDIANQVESGAEHITFGDPDFFNGPSHAIKVVKSLHREWPELSYDVTIKIEHLLDHRNHLLVLRDTGCLFVTTAVESLDDDVLRILDKGHTREDFLRVVSLFSDLPMTLNPTFIPFTPWTTLEGYLELLEVMEELDLVEHVSPIQYAIRLLIPRGSRLLKYPGVRERVGDFDERTLVYPWRHSDRRVDRLQEEVFKAVRELDSREHSRTEVFCRVLDSAERATGRGSAVRIDERGGGRKVSRSPVPHLTEPWYC